LERAEPNPTVVSAPTVPVSGIGRTVRNYVLWSYERGTIHYDVMVTLILIFVLFSPRVINFKDKPVEHNPQRTGVMVIPDGQGGLIYQVEARAIAGKEDGAIRNQLLQIIEPISGEVTISNYEVVRDGSGKILAYKVFVQR
jgi:hypothetical protein